MELLERLKETAKKTKPILKVRSGDRAGLDLEVTDGQAERLTKTADGNIEVPLDQVPTVSLKFGGKKTAVLEIQGLEKTDDGYKLIVSEVETEVKKTNSSKKTKK